MRFNNGLALAREWWASGVPEQLGTFGALVGVHGTADTFVYRWSPEITRSELAPFQIEFGTTVGPDTIWSDAVDYPVVTANIDSTRIFVPPYYEPAKYVCRYGYCLLDSCADARTPGFSLIFYGKALNGGHMEFQACSFEVQNGPTCKSALPLAVHLRWAVDSAGNGLFKDPVSARSRSVARAGGAARTRGHVQFDILGRRVNEVVHVRDVRLVGAVGSGMRREVVACTRE